MHHRWVQCDDCSLRNEIHHCKAARSLLSLVTRKDLRQAKGQIKIKYSAAELSELVTAAFDLWSVAQSVKEVEVESRGVVQSEIRDRREERTQHRRQ